MGGVVMGERGPFADSEFIPDWDKYDPRWIAWHRENPQLSFRASRGIRGDEPLNFRDTPELADLMEF